MLHRGDFCLKLWLGSIRSIKLGSIKNQVRTHRNPLLKKKIAIRIVNLPPPHNCEFGKNLPKPRYTYQTPGNVRINQNYLVFKTCRQRRNSPQNRAQN